MPTERVAWYRGEIVPESQVRISFRDSAAVRGEGVYDTERTFGGRIFRLEQHLDRLWRSMAYLGIEPPIERAELASITEEVARRNCEIVGDDVWVTQRVSRGVGRDAGGDGEPTLIVESLPIPFATRAAGYRDGVRVVTSSLRRTPPWALSPQAKTTNLLNLMMGAAEVRATDPGAWPILLDEHGNLAEGSGANVFVVHGDRVSTPLARYVLPGITRDVVLELATAEGIELVGAGRRPVRRLHRRRGVRHLDQPVRLPGCLDQRPADARRRDPRARSRGASRTPSPREVGMDFVAQYLRYLRIRSAPRAGAGTAGSGATCAAPPESSPTRGRCVRASRSMTNPAAASISTYASIGRWTLVKVIVEPVALHVVDVRPLGQDTSLR